MSSNTNYQFVDTNSNSVVTRLVSSYERMIGRSLNPADPDKLFISWIADIIIQERAILNYVGNQNIPSRASGENLDALGELIYSVKRPAAHNAICTVRFTVSSAQSIEILIPAGTRVTDMNSSLVWSTTKDAFIPAGGTSVDIMVECESAGAAGNNYAAGTINTLIDIDNIPYYSSCENIDISMGGSEAATDDEYYNLMRQGLDAFSVAGPIGAYIYWAKSVSAEISDVKAVCPKQTLSGSLPVYSRGNERVVFIGGDHIKVDTLKFFANNSSPAVLGTDYTVNVSDGLLKIALENGGALSTLDEIKYSVDQEKAGYVYIYALMDDGTIADDTIKSAIYAACTGDHVRPLTDYVAVEDPEVVYYDIRVKYFVPSDAEQSSADIANAVSSAVDEYVAWQCKRLGRDINPSKLNYFLMEKGVKRVEIESPAFTALKDGKDNTIPQLASVRQIEITSGGYEDE